MMAVSLRTDFIQGQFAFKTKKNSGSYKTHHASTKKKFFWDIEKVNVFGFLNSPKRGQKFVYKRLLTKAEKGKTYYYKKFNKHR